MIEIYQNIIDQLTTTVSELALPEGRMVGTPGHEVAKEYLTQRMKDAGLQPYAGNDFQLPYGDKFTNIVGIVPDMDGSTDGPAILVGAHYDTAGPWAGADDNAAAVAILLENAKMLAEDDGQRKPIIFAIFDAEEPPYFHTDDMGSTHFFHHQLKHKVETAIIMDLVGHDVPIEGIEELVFITGTESHSTLGQVHDFTANEPGRLVFATAQNELIGNMSDHHVFEQNDVPFLFLSCGRWQHYHQPSDTPDKLNYTKMMYITMLVFDLITAIDTSVFGESKPGWSSVHLDIDSMNEALYPVLGKQGIVLESYDDIKRLANHLGL